MKRPGSAQVGLAKQFLTRYPWYRLEPRPDTVAWADDQPTKDDIRPCAAGIGMDLRIVYVPRARPVAVKQLAARAKYAVTLFDPVAGGQVSLGQATTDEAGSWRCPPPDHQHDWVVVLKKDVDAGQAEEKVRTVEQYGIPRQFAGTGDFVKAMWQVYRAKAHQIGTTGRIDR